MNNPSRKSRETAVLASIGCNREVKLIQGKHSPQIILWVSAALLLLLTPAIASATSYVYVPNIGTSSAVISDISVIGTASHTKVASLPGTAVVAFTPDGAFAFVVDVGPGGGGNFIVDTRTNEVVGPSPFNFVPVFSHDGATAYFSNDSRTIGVLNTGTLVLTTTIEVPSVYLSPITVTPNGEFLYAAGRDNPSSEATQIFVIDTATNTVADTISIASGKKLGKIAFSPDGTLAYIVMNNLSPATGATEQEIQSINVSTSDVVNTINVADALGKGIVDFEVSRGGDILYVSLGDGLHFINVASEMEVGVVPINVSNFGVSATDYSVTMRGTAITPNGSQIYLSASVHQGSNFDAVASRLFIIDLERRTIVDTVVFSVQSGAPGAWGDPQITTDRACGEDFTSQTLLSKSGFSQFIFPQLQLQFVTVFNARTQAIRGPITLFLTNLKNGTFAGNNAKSTCYAPAGTPYTVLSAGPDNVFSPGEVVIVPLLFFKTGAGPITYSQRVVSGSPGQ